MMRAHIIRDETRETHMSATKTLARPQAAPRRAASMSQLLRIRVVHALQQQRLRAPRDAPVPRRRRQTAMKISARHIERPRDGEEARPAIRQRPHGTGHADSGRQFVTSNVDGAQPRRDKSAPSLPTSSRALLPSSTSRIPDSEGLEHREHARSRVFLIRVGYPFSVPCAGGAISHEIVMFPGALCLGIHTQHLRLFFNGLISIVG